MNRRTLAALSAGVVLGLTSAASGQAWLQDRQFTQGRGIRVGNYELHPGVGVEAGYDSNVFYASSNPTSAFRLRVTPSFYVTTLTQQRSANSEASSTALPTVNFRGGAALVYHEFVPLSSNDTVSQLRTFGGDANVRFDFFPGRTWQFVLADDFSRTVQAGPTSGSAADVSGGFLSGGPNSFNRNYNVANAELAFAPPRGTLEMRFGYNFIFNLFDSANYSFYNYLSHQVYARMRWRFLPKTALLFEGSVTPTSYTQPDRSTTGIFSSYPVTTRVGINGLLTEKLSLMAMVGYTATFFDAGDNADTVVGQAELRWLIAARANVRVGFVRDVANSFFGNYFIRNRGYVSYSQSFGGRFLLSIDGGVGLHQFGYIADHAGSHTTIAVTGADSSGHFTAVRADASLFAEYRFNDVFGINATGRVMANISDVTLGASAQSIAWSRFEAFLGVRAAW